jgi:hypothetical protein
MSARNSATPRPPASKNALAEASLTPASAPQPLSTTERAANLRPVPVRSELPRRFARVPTHAVGVHPEQREYPRATLKLPLKLRSVNHVPEEFPITLVTRDISSTGVYFLCPKPLAAGASVELEIVLVSRPMGRGNVVMTTRAQVLRYEPAATPGWYGIAASFDDVEFDRDDRVPCRFLKR